MIDVIVGGSGPSDPDPLLVPPGGINSACKTAGAALDTRSTGIFLYHDRQAVGDVNQASLDERHSSPPEALSQLSKNSISSWGGCSQISAAVGRG